MHKYLTRLVISAFALAASATLPVTGAWAAGLLYLNDFDTGVLGDVTKDGACYSNSVALVNSPTRSGTKAVKVINDGSKLCDGKHRVELQWGSKTLYSKTNSPYWFGFSMFIPNDYPTKSENSNAVIVAQWIGGSYGPELSFQIVGGEKMAIRRDWSKGPGDTGHEMTHSTVSIERGVWTDWVVYRERSWNNDGVLKIWKNGNKIVDFVGPTAINYEALGNGGNIMFKNGMYWGSTNRPVVYSLMFDDIRTANVTDGYNLVAPNGSSILAAPESPSGLQLQIQ